jgi:hypothetical protein
MSSLKVEEWGQLEIKSGQKEERRPITDVISIALEREEMAVRLK